MRIAACARILEGSPLRYTVECLGVVFNGMSLTLV
jgi:hypothetical protein